MCRCYWQRLHARACFQLLLEVWILEWSLRDARATAIRTSPGTGTWPAQAQAGLTVALEHVRAG